MGGFETAPAFSLPNPLSDCTKVAHYPCLSFGKGNSDRVRGVWLGTGKMLAIVNRCHDFGEFTGDLFLPDLRRRVANSRRSRRSETYSKPTSWVPTFAGFADMGSGPKP